MFYLITLSCIACSALLTLFFTVSRKAFTSMDAIEFKQLSEKLLNKKDTDWWSENLDYVIGGLLIVTSFFQFLLIILSGMFIFNLLRIPSAGIFLTIIFIVTAFLMILILRLIIVNTYLDFYYHWVTRTIHPMKKVFSFLIPAFKKIIRFCIRLSEFLFRNYRPDPDVLELRRVSSEDLPGEPLPEDKKEMIYSIYELGETLVRETMIPRVNMVCIEQNEQLIKGLELINKTGHSRIPVYNEDIDHIVGIFYAKDLLRYWQEHDENVSIKALIRDVYFVPETKHISELLSEFQRQKNHIAVVVDEYGGTAGLITIEDILEEIVGEIRDEYDQEKEKPIQHLEDGSVIIDAKVLIDDITDEFAIEFPEREDYDTLGGFLFSQLERIPAEGEVIHYRNWRFVVTKADERSIKKVKLIKTKRKKRKVTQDKKR